MENYGELVYAHPPKGKILIRKLENISKKLNNCQNAVVFNTTCIKENLLPSFTNLRLHDRAVQQKRFTQDFRRKLVEEEISNKKSQITQLQEELSDFQDQYEDLVMDNDLQQRTLSALDNIITNHYQVGKTRILKKLSRLYGGPLAIPEPSDCFINLSSETLTESQIEFLNLGINCHLIPKYHQANKKVELAVLFEDLCKLQKEKKININPDLQEQLQNESTKSRHHDASQLLSPRLKEAAKQLREKEDIIIRKADKSSSFVILDKEVYLHKCREILQDHSKFKQISRNPVESLKKKLNNLISVANAEVGGTKFDKLIGDFQPGYFYGNVKTHKDGNPLRPIISQIPTPSYRVAKRLHDIISPYIPSTYSLRSTEEFIDILRVNKPNGFMASLDAESLFTNVPVQRTINIILDYVYQHSELPPPSIPKSVMKEMLTICTTEVPFRCPEGKLYVQQDGIAMGSPLGVLFAQAFMSAVEDLAFQDGDVIPNLYCRYIDDIFVCSQSEERLDKLRSSLQEISSLKFSVELNVNGTLPFLDVLVDSTADSFATSVYRKPTNNDKCMNGNSECSDSYKKGVIRAYIKRAIKVCSSWHTLHKELEHVRQMLVDNGYSNTDFDLLTNKILEEFRSSHRPHKPNHINIFYNNTFTNSYKKDEKAIRDIINRNCQPTNEDSEIRLIIYYRNPRTSSLIMKNNLSRRSDTTSRANVVYEYHCSSEDCAPRNSIYIGHTRCSLSRRLTMHQQEGAIKQHHRQHHGQELDRETLVNSTKIIGYSRDPRRLQLLEAIYIREKAPSINIQSNMVSSIPLFNSSIRKDPQHRTLRPPPPPPPPTPPPRTIELRRSVRLQCRNIDS